MNSDNEDWMIDQEYNKQSGWLQARHGKPKTENLMADGEKKLVLKNT